MTTTEIVERDVAVAPAPLAAAEACVGREGARGAQPRTGRIHTIPIKFTGALLLAIAWTGFSVWLSIPWLRDLSSVTAPVFAAVSIAFIAYVPGFMNAFLFATLVFDRRPHRIRPVQYPPVSILVAAFNEASAIADTLKSLALQDYPGEFEVLVLDDGSVDATADIVRSALAALPFPAQSRAQLVRYPHNAGKAAVLNRGLALAQHDLIVTVDGDSWIHADGLRHLVERLMSDPPETQAVAGSVMVRNSRINLLTKSQEWDYFHGIAAVKRMQSMFHGTLVAQGAFSIYRRAALEAVGGWPPCVGEDIVVSWGILKLEGRIGYAEDALCFTNAPTSLRQFARQRQRWSRGLMEAFKAHKELLFKRHLRTVFIWWNLCFPPMDVVYTFVFIPGLILAAFGQFYIVGPATLAILPLAVAWNLFIFRIQRRTFAREHLAVRRNIGGFLFYAFAYNLLVQPVSVLGYASEVMGLRKTWGTK
jgi:biofilm PGA synthesis N-glycosyltransferase PgaC